MFCREDLHLHRVGLRLHTAKGDDRTVTALVEIEIRSAGAMTGTARSCIKAHQFKLLNTKLLRR